MSRGVLKHDPFERARRHSRRVKVLKWALPAGGVALAVIFAGAAWLASPGSIGFQLGSTSVQDGRLVMANPKLDGFTTDNRAYSMSAARASQPIGDGNLIDLEGINARLPLEGDDWIMVVAKTGTFDRAGNRLEVTSPMTVTTEKGINAQFRSASIDIDSGAMQTSEPVEIDLDGTRITADSMQIAEDGAIMIFEDKVRMRIEGDRLQSASTASGETQ